MKKIILIAGAIVLFAGAALAQATKPAKMPKEHKMAKSMATDDAGIQQCIEGRLAKTKMAKEGFQVSVNDGTATFSGSTKDAGHKGGVSGLSTKCGAKSVVNNISIEGKPMKEHKPKMSKPKTS